LIAKRCESQCRHPIGCLLGAIQMVAIRMGRKDQAKDAVVRVSVHIGEPEEIGGFGIGVDIKVEGVDDDVLRGGHEVRIPCLRSAIAMTWFCVV